METSHVLAIASAVCNGAAAAAMLTARARIRRGDRQGHRRGMLTAVGASCVFLVFYLTRMALFGDRHFQGTGGVRVAYLILLATHVLAAMAVVPLVLRSLYLGLRARFDKHRAWARIAYPVWLYVSVTGVVVYALLYHWPV
ncbi:MAG: DUF420 domain-containing protein [Deltaproteobacteria bacterium]|nr:DUF420 domain-containing protein [Deltaproteobacteria bacterium]